MWWKTTSRESAEIKAVCQSLQKQLGFEPESHRFNDIQQDLFIYSPITSVQEINLVHVFNRSFTPTTNFLVCGFANYPPKWPPKKIFRALPNLPPLEILADTLPNWGVSNWGVNWGAVGRAVESYAIDSAGWMIQHRAWYRIHQHMEHLY